MAVLALEPCMGFRVRSQLKRSRGRGGRGEGRVEIAKRTVGDRGHGETHVIPLVCVDLWHPTCVCSVCGITRYRNILHLGLRNI